MRAHGRAHGGDVRERRLERARAHRLAGRSRDPDEESWGAREKERFETTDSKGRGGTKQSYMFRTVVVRHALLVSNEGKTPGAASAEICAEFGCGC